MLNPDYQEVDPSALATLTVRFFEELEAQKSAKGRNFWDRYCEENASAVECRVYED